MVEVTKHKSYKTLASHNTYYCDVLTLCEVYVLELLHFETLTFSDATLSDINVVLFYVLSQYRAGYFLIFESIVTFISTLVTLFFQLCHDFI